MPRRANGERTILIFGLALATLGLILVFAPSFLAMDMMSGGYALQFIGLMVALSGLVVAWFYAARAAVLDHMLDGRGVLAHWTHDLDEYRRQVNNEYAQRLQDNRNLLKLTAVIMLIVDAAVFTIPLLRGEDVLPLVLVLYFGLLLILALAALGAPWLAHRRALQASTDVYISEEGIYQHGRLDTWKQPFWELKRVRFNPQAGKEALEFDLRYLTRLGWVHYETTTVRVLVPSREDAAAEKVVRFFSEKHGK
jgi:hypothetical protein